MSMPTYKQNFKAPSRRELFKLLPLAALGVFAVPKFQEPLLKKGLAFSDWMSDKCFRSHHLAPTFKASDLTPLDTFYVNTFDVDDPEANVDRWSLAVIGQVQKPGTYNLAAIKALPQFDQTTRD